MGARTLEARLIVRLLALCGTVLVAVGVAAVVVTDRVLYASDTARAAAGVAAARDALSRELDEGDAPEDAVKEVVAASDTEGVRLSVHLIGNDASSGAVGPWRVDAGSCMTVADEHGQLWRACGAGNARASLVAAIPIGPHRAAVGALARGMGAVVLVALLALWLAVRRAVRAPAAELTALVGWAGRVVDAEHADPPPAAHTAEIVHLEVAFDSLVRRLLEALARERASSAHIAHELRTPLTAMVAELEELRPPDDASRQAIARIRGDVARLADVIEAILVLSDRGQSARSDVIVNVADLARAVAPAGARVEAPDEALVEADERLVALALRNLVDNARKYGAGVRLVRVERDGGRVRLAVVDEGPGLELSARERMFDRYWRGAADREGRGLGLALVRAVAERHGGRAEARPGPNGHGLDVSMTFERLVGWYEHAHGDARDQSMPR
jgi:signal transduction histidine kinase